MLENCSNACCQATWIFYIPIFFFFGSSTVNPLGSSRWRNETNHIQTLSLAKHEHAYFYRLDLI